MLLAIMHIVQWSVFAQTWQQVLARMPLVRPAVQLDKSNAAPLLLESFQSNTVIKAFVLMPGCTDEIYFLEKAKAVLAPSDTTLLAAVTALTNQTSLHVTFKAPFLLLHTDEDLLDVHQTVKDEQALVKLRSARFTPRVVCFDRDWDYLLPMLEGTLKARFEPGRRSPDSWHFYRHAFAAFDLNGEEALRVIALAGKTVYTIEGRTLFGRPKVSFQPDRRGEPDSPQGPV